MRGLVSVKIPSKIYIIETKRVKKILKIHSIASMPSY